MAPPVNHPAQVRRGLAPSLRNAFFKKPRVFIIFVFLDFSCFLVYITNIGYKPAHKSDSTLFRLLCRNGVFMQILGHYIDTAGKRNVLYMKMSCNDLVSIWNRCSDAANFGAHYMMHSVPNKTQVENSASTILNELIENAAKYSNDEPDNIEVYTFVTEDKIVFQVDSLLDEAQYEKFRKLAGEMDESADLNRLYLEKMLHLCDGENEYKSGLGLLMIVNNYDTTLGFKFEDSAAEKKYRVSVQSILPAGEKSPVS